MKKIILIFIVYWLVSSCSNDTNPVVSKVDVLKPLAIGNYWTYSRYDYSESPTNPKIDTAIYSIWKSKNIYDEEFFLEILNSDTSKSILYINRNNGLYLSSQYDNYSYWVVAKYPVSINDSVLYVDYPLTTLEFPEGIGLLKIYNKITSMDTIIEVPKGSFHCIVIKQTLTGEAYSIKNQAKMDSIINDSHFLTQYYSYNTGLIKSVLSKTKKDGSKDISFELRLTDFKLN